MAQGLGEYTNSQISKAIADYALGTLEDSDVRNVGDVRKILNQIKRDVVKEFGQIQGINIDDVLKDVETEFLEGTNKLKSVPTAVSSYLTDLYDLAEEVENEFEQVYKKFVESSIYTILGSVKQPKRSLLELSEEFVFGKPAGPTIRSWPDNVPKFMQDELGDFWVFSHGKSLKEMAEQATDRLLYHQVFLKKYGVGALYTAIQNIRKYGFYPSPKAIKYAILILAGGLVRPTPNILKELSDEINSLREHNLEDTVTPSDVGDGLKDFSRAYTPTNKKLTDFFRSVFSAIYGWV